jgi:hypothetical protein
MYVIQVIPLILKFGFNTGSGTTNLRCYYKNINLQDKMHDTACPRITESTSW